MLKTIFKRVCLWGMVSYVVPVVVTFATTTINTNGVDGLFTEKVFFLSFQEVPSCSIQKGFMALFSLKVINWLVPVKASFKEEKDGLDISIMVKLRVI